MLVGEPYWRREPPDQATLEGCYGTGKEDWLPLPELIESFGLLGCDVVEMVLADQDSWDRYAAASWLNIRRWLESIDITLGRPNQVPVEPMHVPAAAAAAEAS